MDERYKNNNTYNFNLQKLIQPFDFSTDIADQIREVKLTKVKLRPINNSCDICFVLNENSKKDIFNITSELFDIYDPMQMGNFLLRQVCLSIEFYSKKIVYVTIGYPSYVDMRHLSQNEQDLTIKYLKRWGLIRQD